MSKHPTERVRSVAEMQATSMQQSDKALRRMAAAEERLARLEGRLAEKDQLIAEFHEAYGRQADTISALTAVVREIESKVGRGVDQVITGLEGRIKAIEEIRPLSLVQVRAEANEEANIALTSYKIHDRLEEISEGMDGMDARLKELESKPKRGRPKGSKNKPKDTPAVEEVIAENTQIAAEGGDSSNPEASEGMKSRYTGADSE